MNIVNATFEDPLVININGTLVKLVLFQTLEHGNIKFGIDAPRSINVHREEIYHALQQKNAEALEK